MKTKLVVAFLMSAALVACGSKSKKTGTTPANTGGSTTTSAGSATGGQTYGGSAAPMPAPAGGDPCAGPMK